ncbi:MAG: hypothetical protein ABJA57_12475 [Ginsengibacter sp.]
MKKLVLLLMISLTVGFAAKAQDDKDKVKKTSTPVQKVHNAVSEHKHYKGYKTKHKHGKHTRKHKVDMKHGEVKNKKD